MGALLAEAAAQRKPLCHTERQSLNDTQRLQAAKFGRSFLDLYDPSDFVHVGQALKVLNAVRFYEIGIPLSYAQYVRFTRCSCIPS